MESTNISKSGIIILLVAIAILAQCTNASIKKITLQDTPPSPGYYELEFSQNQHTRLAQFYIPDTLDPSRKYPLLLMLHGGGGGKVSQTDKVTDWERYARQERFILVYPYGSGTFSKRLLTWNAGNCCGYAKKKQIDDVKFIDTIINYSMTKLKVDPKRIFVSGLSNGAMMAHALACELSTKIAAIGPVIGALNYANCHPTDAVSVIAFRGVMDKNVKYNGGVSEGFDRSQRVDQSAMYTLETWGKLNRCQTKKEANLTKTIKLSQYTNCQNDTDVMLYSLQNGNHAWPGGKRSVFFLDDPIQEISATKVIWEFFKNHPKKP